VEWNILFTPPNKEALAWPFVGFSIDPTHAAPLRVSQVVGVTAAVNANREVLTGATRKGALANRHRGACCKADLNSLRARPRGRTPRPHARAPARHVRSGPRLGRPPARHVRIETPLR